MSKNLRLNFILSIVFVSIVLAWNTFVSFFGGAGINFVALFLITCALTYIIIEDKFVRSRWMDVFCLLAFLFVMEVPVYFAFEYSNTIANGWFVYQNVISIICFFVTVYMLYRLFLELKNIRFKFFEIILGNEKLKKQPKRAKELTNGALEDKPGEINIDSVEVVSEEETSTQENPVEAKDETEE